MILDEEYGILHVVNYGGGSYVAYSVDTTNGEILEEIYFEDYGKGSNVDPDRQADAHAHMAFFINEFIYVVDLGSDEIHHYKVKSVSKDSTITVGVHNNVITIFTDFYVRNILFI